MIGVFVAAVAVAATPTPDRPSVSRSGYLVAAQTLESEVGGVWQSGPASVPALLKLGLGAVEPRLGLDLSRIDSRSPGLSGGLKVRLVDEDIGLAFYADSAVPLSSDEAWWSHFGGLLTAPIGERWFIQANVLVRLQATTGPVTFGAVPIALAGGAQLFPKFSWFVEAATDLGVAVQETTILDTGLGWSLTDQVVFDAGIGWNIGSSTPILQLGLTTNLGQVR